MYNMTDTSIHDDNKLFFFLLLNKSLCTLSQVGVQILGYLKFLVVCILCMIYFAFSIL